MFSDDQRGYVLSGLGMLLIIPVILLIPLALSVQEEGSTSADIFTKSDTAYRAVSNIIDDVDKQIVDAIAKIDLTVYDYDKAVLLAGNITKVLNNTNVSNYQRAYNNTLDSLKITPHYTCSEPSFNNQSGTLYSSNGIIFQYGPLYNGEGQYYGLVDGYYQYNYTANFTVNMTIFASKVGSSYNNTFERFTTFEFSVNTKTNSAATAATRINQFFADLKTFLINYC